MTKKFPLRVLGFGCSLLACAAYSAGAFAQDIPGSAEPSRVKEQIQKFEPEPVVTPQINIPAVRIEGAPGGAENIKFTLKSLDVEGVTVYSQDEIADIYKDEIGHTITLARLYEIAADITRKYRNDGYIITQVAVPVQTIEHGTARLLVVEGSLDQIVVEGADNSKSEAKIAAIANKLKASEPLKSDDLERYLLIINDLPGVSARSVIGPSPTKTGKADLHIVLDHHPADFFVGVDNYGSAYLGPWQYTGAAQLNNPLGANDSFLLQMATAPRHKELYYIYSAYSLPLDSEGTTLSVDVSRDNTRPGFDLDIFDVKGFATTAGLTVEHPFIRSRNENLSGRVRFEGEDSSTKNALGVRTEDRIRSLRLGGHYERLSTWVGSSVNMFDVLVSKGLGILGASDKRDADLSRADGDPEYSKIEAEMTRLQRIVHGLNVLAGVKGQASHDALLSSEEFGIGGMGSGYGRGYDPSEIVGDKGFAAKAEVQWNPNVFNGTINSMQVFGFYDVGTVWNKDATTSDGKRDSIASTGVGVRSKITDNISADATLAFPLTVDVGTKDDHKARWFVSLTGRF